MWANQPNPILHQVDTARCCWPAAQAVIRSMWHSLTFCLAVPWCYLMFCCFFEETESCTNPQGKAASKQLGKLFLKKQQHRGSTWTFMLSDVLEFPLKSRQRTTVNKRASCWLTRTGSCGEDRVRVVLLKESLQKWYLILLRRCLSVCLFAV